MAYRPFPNVERALAQVRRRQPDASAMPECLRPVADSFAKLRTDVRRYVIGLGQDVGDIESMREEEVAALRLLESPPAFPVDEYRLSTRPRIVGGGR